MDVLSWDEFVVGIEKCFKLDYVIASVWHPEPKAELIHTNHGTARVLAGAPQFQLSTGEIVKL